MSVKVELNVEQLASAFLQLSPREIEKLEELIGQKTTSEILKRSREVRGGDYLKLEEVTAFRDID